MASFMARWALLSALLLAACLSEKASGKTVLSGATLNPLLQLQV